MSLPPAPRPLDVVVTAVATKLMAATATTAGAVSEAVLADLVDYLGVDVSFLRHNDHDIRASLLVAEWPRRADVPDPDPLGLIHFDGADPIFAASEHFKTPQVVRPEPATADYQALIEAGSGVPATSMAAAPLVSGEVTTGVLGFIKFGDRSWSAEELTALEAVATLFAQLQARISAEKQLRYLAEHDDLTGAHNRRALLAHLEQRLAAHGQGPVSLLFLDLDRLKAINDYLGHNAGDRFICAIAERLPAATGGAALIARLGGDEFVVVPYTPMDSDAAEALAHRVHAVLTERVSVDGEMLSRTVSIGVATGVPGRHSTTDLLRWADQALLEAKSAGGNQVAVFTQDMAMRNDFHNEIELDLQGATETDSLVLNYLPEIDLRTGQVVAAEALLRWQHPTRGLLMPDSFVAVAESANLAGEMGRWVIDTACAEFSGWRANGLGADAVLRLNVSPIQLVSPRFVSVVADTLDKYGLAGRSVCVEITESVVVQDIEATRKTLAGLKEVGVQVAIDDFGTGYSVLSHLKSLPVDTLKIDKSFVCDLGTNAEDLAIVRAIIALASAFGVDVVAEGVEHRAAALTLLQLGCFRAQGYLLSRPVDESAMQALFAKGFIPLNLSNEQAVQVGQTG